MVEEGLSLEVTFTQRKQLMQRFKKEQNGMFCQLEDRKRKGMRERGVQAGARYLRVFQARVRPGESGF